MKEYIVILRSEAVEIGKKQIRRVAPYAPYVALTVLVLGPLIAPGFVLTMDMVFTPHIPMPDHIDNTYLLYAFLSALSNVFPGDVVEKGLLIATLLLSGVGAHMLLERSFGELTLPKRWTMFIASAFYMVNPFVYDRFMAGQYGVLLGYGLLPWFTRFLIAFVRGPSLRSAATLGVIVTAMSIVSIHSLGFVVVMAIVAICLYGRRQGFRRLALYGGVALSLFIVASSYWLVPAILGHGKIAASLATFSGSERQAFATLDTNGLGPLGSILGLQGFWQENRSLFLTVTDVNSAWGIVQILLWVLVGWGIVVAWRTERREGVFYVAIGIIGAVLASGLGGEWLALHVPFFAGFREPQKFVAMVALASAYFVAYGAYWLIVRTQRLKWLSIGLLVLLIGGFTPTMWWGFGGQLQSSQYPSDWFYVNQKLGYVDGQKVLFLPWHLYMSYSFAHDRIIACPAPAFFTAHIIASDDPELRGVAPQTVDATRLDIQQKILPAAASGAQVSQSLRSLGVGYILVAKEYDYEQYEYLTRQSNITLVMDTQRLRLYKVAP